MCGGSLAKWETSNGCGDRVIFVADMSQHLRSLTKQDSDVRVVHVDPTTSDPRIQEVCLDMTLAMRPNTQALRGLALLTSVTAWPNFSMGEPLQGQLLRLEEAFDETANGFISNLGIIIPSP